MTTVKAGNHLYNLETGECIHGPTDAYMVIPKTETHVPESSINIPIIPVDLEKDAAIDRHFSETDERETFTPMSESHYIKIPSKSAVLSELLANVKEMQANVDSIMSELIIIHIVLENLND